jgi:hypothetical protein
MYCPTYVILVLISLISIMCIITNNIKVVGQTDNNIFTKNQTTNQTEAVVSQLKAHNITSQIIKIPAIAFNQHIAELQNSISLLRNENYDEALSHLGMATVHILNSTQQYKELAKFAYSQFTNIEQGLTE